MRDLAIEDEVKLKRATTQLTKLRKALRRYGWHRDGCLAAAYRTETRKPIGIACTCGLNTALRRSRQ